jgi:hypothetical protein
MFGIILDFRHGGKNYWTMGGLAQYIVYEHHCLVTFALLVAQVFHADLD